MALFNLTDIAYRKEGERNFNSFANLRADYRTDLMRYPIDVGTTDRGHYMLIHINVQEKTAYKASFADDLPTIHRNRTGLQKQTGAVNAGGNAKLLVDNLNKVGQIAGDAINRLTTDRVKNAYENAKTSFSTFIANQMAQAPEELNAAARYGADVVRGAVAGAEQAVGSLDNPSFLRKIKRTTETIALYMPGTMAYNHQQSYNKLSLGGENAALAGAGLSLINDAIANKISAEQLGRNLTPFIAERLTKGLSGVIGQNSAQAIFASALGGVQNPQLELIYNSPDFRSFRFDFMFYPSSEGEALEVQKIIESLKFHQAPEIMNGTAGYFLVPPSEFDIQFYYNGQINPNIPPISTCVLTSIDMDYAPKGFVAYEVPGENNPSLGGTGMPFAIRLSLSFQETEIMTKFNFQETRKKANGELRSDSDIRPR